MRRVHLACLLIAVLLPRTASAQDRFFNSNGASLRYADIGTGTPVVLLHGLENTLDVWTNAGVIQDLAKDHRVIVFDARGHGKSARPHDPSQYGREMALDVVRLLDYLGIRSAHVVAYSFGAAAASIAMTLHPERFRSLTLVAAAVRLAPLPPGVLSNYEQQAGEIERECISRTRILREVPAGTPPPTEQDLRALAAACMSDPSRDQISMAALIRSRAQQGLDPDALRASTVPLFGIVGSEDGARAAEMKAIQQLRPDMPIVVLEGATHFGDRGILGRAELRSELRRFIRAAEDRL